jgi:predicted hydrocarbon binding protein
MTEQSILFSSVLSTLTVGLRNLYYKNGISIGRTLYSIYRRQKHYIWYEESVADLVSFFESAGFSAITYNIFPDRIDIKFHSHSKEYLGTNMHVFECGVICGFLSSAKQQHVKVDEISCSNNDSNFCHFITSESLPLYLEPKGTVVLKKFANLLKESISTPNKKPKPNFMEEYYILSSFVFLEDEYHEHMHKIVYHLGSEISSMLGINRLNQKSARSIERLYELLGLGKLSIRSTKRIDMEIHFDRLKAKKGLVDISIAFLNGLLKDAITKDSHINTKGSKKDNSYVVRITESKK